MKKLIELENEFYVIDDSEIMDIVPFKGMWHIEKGSMVNQFPSYLTDLSECNLITHSTKGLEGVTKLDKSEIEKLIYGYSAEEMAKPTRMLYGMDFEYWNFIRGFKEHQKIAKDKLFTKEQIEEAMLQALRYGYAARCTALNTEELLVNDFLENKTNDLIISNLHMKTEWDIEIDDLGKIKLL